MRFNVKRLVVVALVFQFLFYLVGIVGFLFLLTFGEPDLLDALIGMAKKLYEYIMTFAVAGKA